MAIIAIENGPVEIIDLPIKLGDFPFIDAPCMVYLPTFGWFLGQVLVNIPNMEHMGIDIDWNYYSYWLGTSHK